MTSEQSESVVLRRPSARTQKFEPRPTSEPGEIAVLTRNMLRATSGKTEHQTSRERIIAGDLPDWEPLPPGEILGRRPRTRS